MAREIQIDGLSVSAPHSLHRLELTACVLDHHFPGAFSRLRRDLASAIGYLPVPLETSQRRQVDFVGMLAMVGWFHPQRLEQLLHREWLAAPTNEFATHEAVLDRLESLADARRVCIVGAGTCRLAEYLARRPQLERIVCGDVSLIALSVGRMMMHGARDQLPLLLRRTISIVDVCSDGHRLQRRHVEPAYLDAVPPSRPDRFSYTVLDAFSPRFDREALVCLHYVLDAPARYDTMLVRCCASLASRQRLVVITAVSDATRHPVDVVDTLERSGVRIDHVAIERLPYSLSRHDFAYETTTSNTLIVEATKVDEGADPHVFPTLAVPDMLASAARKLSPAQQHAPFPIEPRLASVVDKALRRRTHRGFQECLAAELGPELADEVSSYLAAREYVVATHFPDRYRTRTDVG